MPFARDPLNHHDKEKLNKTSYARQTGITGRLAKCTAGERTHYFVSFIGEEFSGKVLMTRLLSQKMILIRFPKTYDVDQQTILKEHRFEPN